MEEKRCPKCKTTKPVSEFYKSKQTKDGLRSWCKECFKAGTRTDYHKRPPKPRSLEPKRCSSCGEIKPADQFDSKPKGGDGLDTRCKACMSAYSKLPHRRATTRRLHKERGHIYETNVKETRQRWRKSDAGKISRKNRHQTYVRLHPEVRNAHNAVQYAIRTGRLPHISQVKCKQCGEQATEYHHFKGYESQHRLDVIPLCDSCHTKAHLKD